MNNRDRVLPETERIEWDEASELKGHKPGVEDDSAGVVAH